MDNQHHPFWQFAKATENLPPCHRSLGWRMLEGEPGIGRIVLAFDAKPEFANPAGFVMGGILSAMLDAALGEALIPTLRPEEMPLTLEMKVSFLAPAPITTLRAEGRLLRRGRAIAFCEADIWSPDGVCIAKASSSFKIHRSADQEAH